LSQLRSQECKIHRSRSLYVGVRNVTRRGLVELPRSAAGGMRLGTQATADKIIEAQEVALAVERNATWVVVAQRSRCSKLGLRSGYRRH
jgi:hypothetical protein